MASVLKSSSPTVIVESEFDEDRLLRIPADAHTLAGFRRWVHSDEFPEKQRVTFINGEIYLDMTKENLFIHAAIKTELGIVLGSLFREKDLGDIFINGVLVTNEGARVSNNPDMVGILWESLEGGKVRYVKTSKYQEMEIEGSPDWILEIVSEGSVVKDKHDLREAYHKAGIREYWIIDARGEEIEFQVLTWRKNSYAATPIKEGWLRSRVFDRSFQLTRSKGRRGEWRYRLAMKKD